MIFPVATVAPFNEIISEPIAMNLFAPAVIPVVSTPISVEPDAKLVPPCSSRTFVPVLKN